MSDQPPRPEEAISAYQADLGPDALRMLTAACEHEPEFLALVERPSSRPFMVRAVIDAGSRPPEESLDQWIVKVTASFLHSLCEDQPHTLFVLTTLAREDFLLGPSPRYARTAVQEQCHLADGTDATKWLEWIYHSDASFTSKLVRDYFIAQEVAWNPDANFIGIEYPQRWVLMFLAVLAPELVTRMAHLRSQIEEEVTQRVQAALSHQLKRSAGAVRSNLKKIRSKLSQETFRQLHTEYDRILQESQFQIDLAERTGLWSAQPELRIETTSVLEAVDEVLGPLREKYPAVELVVAVPTTLRAHADARLVREILFCLVENAIHAVTYAGPELRGRVEVHGVMTDQRIRLEILDNGPGVHPGDTSRVFEPRVTTKKGGEHPLGTGMGLPIARRYARLMAGDVDIDASRSETCFFVELPRAAQEGST